eukprot:753039-Hanusia_phi.AAC.7
MENSRTTRQGGREAGRQGGREERQGKGLNESLGLIKPSASAVFTFNVLCDLDNSFLLSIDDKVVRLLCSSPADSLRSS